MQIRKMIDCLKILLVIFRIRFLIQSTKLFKEVAKLYRNNGNCNQLFKNVNAQYSLIKENDNKYHFVVTSIKKEIVIISLMKVFINMK